MTEPAQDLAAAVEAEEVIDFCRELVRVPSENPPGDEREVAAVAERMLGGLGLTAERVESAPGRISLLASWGSGDGPTLCFNGHYDVVPATNLEGWPYPPYAATIADGKLYGRGSSDMKGSIAACLGAVSALQRSGFQPKGTLAIHLVADEEAAGTLGAKYLVENGYCRGITEAIVGEPTSLNLVTAERGALWLKVATKGVSAHASSPRLGVNAIEHMARVVTAVQGMRFRKLHEMLGAPTVSVGTISGGSKVNMVPDYCEMELDRRTLPGETIEDVVGEVQSVLDKLKVQIPDLDARLVSHEWAEASETPPGTRVVDLLREAAEACGGEPVELGFSGATDARFLINQGGIPTVVFGVGDLLVAHTTGEFLEVEQLVQGARIYAHAFARFLS